MCPCQLISNTSLCKILEQSNAITLLADAGLANLFLSPSRLEFSLPPLTTVHIKAANQKVVAFDLGDEGECDIGSFER